MFPESAGSRRWFGYVTVLLVVAGCGWYGFHEYVGGSNQAKLSDGWFDLMAYDILLFVNNAPLDAAGPLPWPLQFARFAAPITAALVVPLLVAAIRSTLRRRRRGHAIVAGDTSLAEAISKDLASAGTRVVRVVSADLTSAEAWRARGVAGAAFVYCCADDGHDAATNLTAALVAATAVRGRRRRLKVYAHVSDDNLAVALRARQVGVVRAGHVSMDFFNAHEIAARAWHYEDAVSTRAGRPVHLVIAGMTALGRSLLVEFARQWRLAHPTGSQRVAVTVVDPAARRAVADLSARWSVIGESCDVTAVDGTLADLGQPLSPPDRAYVCYDDDVACLSASLATPVLWGGSAGSLVVRLGRTSSVEGLLWGTAHPLLDDLGGRLRSLEIARLSGNAEAIQEDMTERMAQAVHECFLVEQLRAGYQLGFSTSMRPWRELSDQLKHANRAQADGIGGMLRVIGCTVAPRAGRDFSFESAEVEVLAVHEHDRWLRERLQQGWHFDSGRNDARRRHPGLVPWANLAEEYRETNRDAVRSIVAVVNSAGLDVVRLSRVEDPLTPATVG